MYEQSNYKVMHSLSSGLNKFFFKKKKKQFCYLQSTVLMCFIITFFFFVRGSIYFCISKKNNICIPSFYGSYIVKKQCLGFHCILSPWFSCFFRLLLYSQLNYLYFKMKTPYLYKDYHSSGRIYSFDLPISSVYIFQFKKIFFFGQAHAELQAVPFLYSFA